MILAWLYGHAIFFSWGKIPTSASGEFKQMYIQLEYINNRIVIERP